MRTLGLTLAWIMGSIYASIPVLWLAIHPFAERWRSGKGKNYPLTGVVWLALIFIAVGLTWRWRSETLYESVWSLAVAVPLFLFGFLTYRRIGKDFGGDRLTGRAEISPEKYEQRLVTTGMHARMRHPIYLAHLWMLTAWTLGSGLKVLFALWVFAIVTGTIMIRMEDAELEQRFGNEFRNYKKWVPAISLSPHEPNGDLSATAKKLRRMIGSCGICKTDFSAPHQISNHHQYAQFATMIGDEEHQQEIKHFINAARNREWNDLHVLQQFDGRTNDLVADVIRCSNGGGMMVAYIDPVELWAAEEIFAVELLSEEEISSITGLVSEKWEEL